jgi:SET domain-containing protein
MDIIAIKDIGLGEQILVNYNGEPSNQDPLWFTQRTAKPRRSRKKSRKKSTRR